MKELKENMLKEFLEYCLENNYNLQNEEDYYEAVDNFYSEVFVNYLDTTGEELMFDISDYGERLEIEIFNA